jgi:hypothetical protein
MGAGVGYFKRYSLLIGSWQTGSTRGSLTPKEDKSRRTGVARLKVISGVQARAGRRVILKSARGQPLRSRGPLTFECGNCGTVVLQNVNLEQIQNCIIECDPGIRRIYKRDGVIRTSLMLFVTQSITSYLLYGIGAALKR